MRVQDLPGGETHVGAALSTRSAVVVAPIWHKSSIAADTGHCVECQRFNMSSKVPHAAGTEAVEENLVEVHQVLQLWRSSRVNQAPETVRVRLTGT